MRATVLYDRKFQQLDPCGIFDSRVTCIEIDRGEFRSEHRENHFVNRVSVQNWRLSELSETRMAWNKRPNMPYHGH